MAGTNESVLERLATQAIAGGARTLKIGYDEGYEEVYACQGDIGVSMGSRIPSCSKEAKSLRAELYSMGECPRRIEIGGRTYEMRCRTYDSFGEDPAGMRAYPSAQAKRTLVALGKCRSPVSGRARRPERGYFSVPRENTRRRGALATGVVLSSPIDVLLSSPVVVCGAFRSSRGQPSRTLEAGGIN
jgi:hypothetical protein